MSDELVQSVVSAAKRPDGVTVAKDSPGTLRLFGIALAVLCLFAAAVIGLIAFLKWPESVAHDRVNALAWIGWLSIGGVLLWTATLCSPYIGRIQVSAGPVTVGVDGLEEAKNRDHDHG